MYESEGQLILPAEPNHANEPEKSPPLSDSTYKAHRQHLIDGERGQTGLYDRSIITLTAAALGLSLAFIKDIVPEITLRTLWILYGAWGGFVLSLLSTLASFQFSQRAYKREREILDEKQRGNIDKNNTLNNRWSRRTTIANVLSIAAFIIATLLLLVFAAVNLSKEGVKMSQDDRKHQQEKTPKPTPEHKIEYGEIPPEPPVEPEPKPKPEPEPKPKKD